MRRGLGKHGESALLQDLSLLPPAKGDKDTVSVAKKDAVGGAVPYNVECLSEYILQSDQEARENVEHRVNLDC